MKNRTFFKAVGPYLVALSVLILTALLVAVIFFTQFSLPWVAFLTGVLAAAILSMVSRSSKAEWIIARREAKISQLQHKLAEEIQLNRELERKLTDQPILHPGNEQQIAVAAASEIFSPLLADASGTAQDLFVQTLSEEMAGPDDAIGRIMSAIEHNEFRLYSQLITPLSAASADDRHHEILVRLIEEEEHMMPPGAFFPLVEKYGLMPHLDRWVVQHVVEWLATHPAPSALQEHSIFFINLSSESLADGGFPQFVRDQLLHNKVSAGHLCFEIPETELSRRHDDIILFAKKVRDNGCRIAISGFGRRGEVFRPLHEIHADFIKIDGGMIFNFLRDPADLALVIAIVKTAKNIGIKTIAEMVESDECVAKLRQIGIDFAQGFGVAIPAQLESLVLSPT